MEKNSSIFIAGHQGLVGSAIVRQLGLQGFTNLVVQTRQQLDLTRQAEVERFFAQYRPEYVFFAAAKVGGIHANSHFAADFIGDNLQIQNNIIQSSFNFGAKKLLFLGSSCIYPRESPQPISEESLLTGPLEETNEWYAVAKIAGIKLCQAYRKQHGFNAISLMPTNLYGPGDNFHPLHSHVLPALIRRFHDAKQEGLNRVTVWGSGTPRREFLHVDDMADAAVFLMLHYHSGEIVNVGWGVDMTIKELAHQVGETVGFGGTIAFDPSKPDGTPVKCLDVSRLSNLGWRPKIPFALGLKETYAWFLEHQHMFRR